MSNLTIAVDNFIERWNPIAESLAEAAEADAGFDAGEFSASFHDDIHDMEWQTLLEAVADLHCVEVEELDEAIYVRMNEECY